MLPTDPELLLVEAEPEQSLKEELDALRHTGSWQPESDQDSIAKKTKSTRTFPLIKNKQVAMYLDIFQNRQKKTFRRWLERSGKYLPMLTRELRDAGLPEDLAYLAMIESGFNQRAYSHAKAVGLWQFMKSTGKGYNLKIDKYVDERRHAEKSTKAAVAYLSDLYADFGDWYLAVAAYNAGPYKIKKGLKKYKCNNFWHLAQHRHLKLETKRYVPKLIAAILIAKNPKRYGFTDLKYDTPLNHETLRVGPGLSLDAVALLCKTTSKTIKELNQELKSGRTPLNKSYYNVQIPKGSKKFASTNLSRLNTVVSTGYKIHIIRRGDSLSTICKRYNINKTTLLKVNNLRSSKLIRGRHLRIPYSTVRYRLLDQGTNGKLASDDLILHTVKQGETLSGIAASYKIPSRHLIAWNGLKNSHRIKAGQQLALYIEDTKKTISVTHKPKKHTIIASVNKKRNSALIILAEQKKFATGKKTHPKTQFSLYQVREGDSLWTIAQKFNLSTKQLKSWNKLKSNRIQPGIKLKINNV